MTEHIDNNLVNTNLRYRFNYLSKFLNFTPNDIAMLNAFAPILSPRIPVIADTVYRKLFSFDITKHYFLIGNQGFDKFSCDDENNLTLESAQMTFRKDMLSMYLKRVLTQSDWNDTFLQYLSQVGQMHTNQAGSSSINIDYIHINALLGCLEHLLINILWNIENFEEKTRYATIIAINKLFWIQNDFFTMHFITTAKEESSSASEKITKDPSCCCLLN
jgi:hypothetical protein